MDPCALERELYEYYLWVKQNSGLRFVYKSAVLGCGFPSSWAICPRGAVAVRAGQPQPVHNLYKHRNSETRVRLEYHMETSSNIMHGAWQVES